MPRLVPPARRAALRRRLLAWWDAGHRALPWRFPQQAADPYRVWLAEVMLQQTQVATALPYYQRFVARWPTLADLAAAPDGEVLSAWSGLGYYARCRNLLAAARAALRGHGGLPASHVALRALPGFGPYTAGAVASIAFAIPVAAVDGNVARVLSRLFRVEGDPASRKTRERLWALAAELVGEGEPGAAGPAARPLGTGRRGRAVEPGGLVRPGDWNQALMELGATVCTRPVPACGRCPVEALCLARGAGRERDLPPPRRRPARQRLVLACAVVEEGGRVLLVRRPTRGLFAGLLGFPAVEVADGADARTALGGALRDVGAGLEVGAALGAVERTLTHRELELRAYCCKLVGHCAGEHRWVPWGALDGAGMPAAMRALVPLVRGLAGSGVGSRAPTSKK